MSQAFAGLTSPLEGADHRGFCLYLYFQLSTWVSETKSLQIRDTAVVVKIVRQEIPSPNLMCLEYSQGHYENAACGHHDLLLEACATTLLFSAPTTGIGGALHYRY